MPVSIPSELEARIRAFATELAAHHRDVFSLDAQMKNRLAGLLRRCLPPRPRRPGRPGFVSVTAAIKLLAELQGSFPERPAKEIWQELYRRIIPEWDTLKQIERRDRAYELHRRVRGRLYIRRRKHKKQITQNSITQN